MSRKRQLVQKTQSDPYKQNHKKKTYQSQQTEKNQDKLQISDSESSTESFLNGGISKIRQKVNNDNISQEYEDFKEVEKKLMRNNDAPNEDLQKFKRMLVNHIENRILNSQKQFEEAIHEELELFEGKVNLMLTNLRDDNYYQERTQNHKIDKEIEKIFRYKPSLLTEMLKQSNYKTLYNMIVASLFAMMGNVFANDYMNKNILFDLETFTWCFKNLHSVCYACLLIQAWGYSSIIFVMGYKMNQWSGLFGILLYLVLQFIQMAFPCYLSFTMDLGFGTQMIILCEGVRIMLKNHSYIRNKILYGTKNTLAVYVPPSFQNQVGEDQNTKFPQISIGSFQRELKKYTYFMLAPTLIYRDTYLKAPHRSKKTIFIELSNFLLSIYYGFILFKSFIKEPMLELRDNLTFIGFLFGILKLMMPSTCAFILVFFGLFHSWMNAWAELLRFPDRTFYLDWWTSQEFGQYYRKWNIIVHEFLYYYVYIDVQKLSRGKIGKSSAQALTFLISAVIHEIVLGFALGFFYPICFLMFTGPGILLIRQGQKLLKKQWVNIIFWALMYLGTSLMITLYLVEYYARQNVTDQFMWQQWGILSYLIPRTFYL